MYVKEIKWLINFNPELQLAFIKNTQYIYTYNYIYIYIYLDSRRAALRYCHWNRLAWRIDEGHQAHKAQLPQKPFRLACWWVMWGGGALGGGGGGGGG